MGFALPLHFRSTRAGSAPSRELLLQPELAGYGECWGRQGDLGILAMGRDAPAGGAWLRLMPGYGLVEEGIPELSLAVVSDSRGRGIGTSLLKALIHSAASVYQAISLNVTSENPALHLYERLGFQVVRADGDSKIMRLRM